MCEKYILILGGNGFIGAECVEHLLDNLTTNSNDSDYKLILVNRGNWDDWDTRERIKSRVHHTIRFDRSDDSPDVLRSALSRYLDDEQREGAFRFEAVVDFSGFKSKQVESVCRAIPGEAIRLYVYISTDSVYEVSVRKAQPQDLLLETDSVRPDDPDEVARLKKLDSYAHHKLKCEETLISLSRDKFPYVILRLPDVIGERDSSHRFWQLQMQLEYREYTKPDAIHTIEISRPFYQLKTNYVNVKDIARVVASFVVSSKIQNQVFNIGFPESISLIDFYRILGEKIKPGLGKRLEFVSTDETIFHPFPSVTRGAISIAKLQHTLGFKPIVTIDELFAQCVGFYREAYGKYPEMRKQVEKEVRKDLGIKKSDVEKENFDTFIKNYRI